MSVIAGARRATTAERLLAVVPPALPAAIVVAVGVVLALSHGGFAAATWYPAALFLTGLLVVVLVLAAPAAAERSRLTEAALGAYGLFTAWAYLGILWAESPGLAWEGANRTLLYGVVLALVTLRPWPRPATLALLGFVVAVTTALALGVLLVAGGGEPRSLVLSGRLIAPAGYANATPALWLIGFWPALWLACTPMIAWPLRGLALAAAGVLAQTALLSQSRGAAAAFVVIAVLFVAFVPRRWSALLAIAAILAAVRLGFGKLLAPYEAGSLPALTTALGGARNVILLSAAGLGVLGALAAFAGRAGAARMSPRPAIARAGNWLLAALALATIVVALAATGNPQAWAKSRWQDFKGSGYSGLNAQGTRFGGSLGSNRYDFYRVALDEFRKHPVRGIGLDNFGPAYLRHRRSYETPRYAHSLGFMLLGESGALGTGLFLAFAVLVMAAVTRAARRATALDRGLVVAAAAGAGTFFVHGLVDWLWQFPALGVFAFTLLGAAARTTPAAAVAAGGIEGQRLRVAEAPGAGNGRHPRVVARRFLGIVATLAVALSFALPGISARYVDAAYARSAKNPALAVARLRRAAQLNFLSADPLLAEGIIARRLGDRRASQEALRRALQREPHNWFAYFELALVQGISGAPADARANLERARALNPGQAVIGAVAGELARGERIDPDALEGQLSSQLQRRLSPVG